MSDSATLALKRLKENNRVCDGCGQRVNRFTVACHYDSIFNRVYGSVCGCAEKMRNAPFCSSCGDKTNPFVPGSIVIPKAGANAVVCPKCAEGLGEFEPKKTGKNGAVAKKVTLEKHPDLTERELKLAKEGPYIVIEKKRGWYQVGIPATDGGLATVRSTSGNLAAAIRACTKFNSE